MQFFSVKDRQEPLLNISETGKRREDARRHCAVWFNAEFTFPALATEFFFWRLLVSVTRSSSDTTNVVNPNGFDPHPLEESFCFLNIFQISICRNDPHSYRDTSFDCFLNSRKSLVEAP